MPGAYLDSLHLTTKDLAKLLDCTDTGARQSIYRNKLHCIIPNKRTKRIYVSGIEFAQLLCDDPISRRRWVRQQQNPKFRSSYAFLIQEVNQYILNHECKYLPLDIANLYDIHNSDPIRYMIKMGKIIRNPGSRYLTMTNIRQAVAKFPELRYYFNKEVNLI